MERSEKSLTVSVLWLLHTDHTLCFVPALALNHNNLDKYFSVRIVRTSVRPLPVRDDFKSKKRPNKRCWDLQFFLISEAMAANHSWALTLCYVKNSTGYSRWELTRLSKSIDSVSYWLFSVLILTSICTHSQWMTMGPQDPASLSSIPTLGLCAQLVLP